MDRTADWEPAVGLHEMPVRCSGHGRAPGTMRVVRPYAEFRISPPVRCFSPPRSLWKGPPFIVYLIILGLRGPSVGAVGVTPEAVANHVRDVIFPIRQPQETRRTIKRRLNRHRRMPRAP